MSDVLSAIEHLRGHRAQQREDLKAFLSIPSVSALSEHKSDVRKAAHWLRDRLDAAGFLAARLEETDGNPLVRAESPHVEGQPTVLVYGHYDVQPVDPVESWHHGPFDPIVEDDILYGRGASDDKGQVYMQLVAAEAWMKTRGHLPVNVKFLFEGEEEIGSAHLASYIKAHADDLRSDLAMISDTPMYADGYPAISYGLRGLSALEIDVEGPFQDLHSGVYGGAVLNPAHALASLIASLHDPEGRVAVEGFYDQVDPMPPAEREALARLPFDPETYRKGVGSPALFGEAGYSVLEQVWARPTLEVNGMWSGFTGEGQKTIIPRSAHAKISCRLVPHQDPEQVTRAIIRHLERHCPPGVTITCRPGEGSPASLIPMDHKAIKATEEAITTVYETRASYIRMGGSIPVVVDFQEVLKIPTLLLGFALPDENFHAPNEHFHLENFRRGADTLVHLWDSLSR